MLRHSAPDLVSEAHDVVGSCSVVANDGERVLARQADRAVTLSARKTGVFDQPRRTQLHTSVRGWVARHTDADGDALHAVGHARRDDRIQKERAAAASVWIA